MDKINAWDIAEVAALLWKRKLWILACMLLSFILGHVYLRFADPIYSASAILIPKEGEKRGAGGILSQLGGLGGMMGGFESSLPALKRIEILATGYSLNRQIIEKYNLLPRIFPEQWDRSKKAWSGNQPSVDAGYGMIRKNMLKINPDAKNNLLVLTVEASDPKLANDLALYYLTELNAKIRDDAIEASKSNLRFLDGQYANTSDPEFRRKMQDLMAAEIEKSMLLSERAFEVIEEPRLPKSPDWPRARFILGLAVSLGFLGSCFLVLLVTAFGSFKRAVIERISQLPA